MHIPGKKKSLESSYSSTPRFRHAEGLWAFTCLMELQISSSQTASEHSPLIRSVRIQSLTFAVQCGFMQSPWGRRKVHDMHLVHFWAKQVHPDLPTEKLEYPKVEREKAIWWI